jgi:hypothetical protein
MRPLLVARRLRSPLCVAGAQPTTATRRDGAAQPRGFVMRIVRSTFAVVVFATFPPILLIAQEPSAAGSLLEASENKPDPVLLSAKPLLNASLWHMVAPKKGETEKLEEVGVIRDFVVEAAMGRFESLVVEPKPGSAFAKTRLLSMHKVRWDAGRAALITDLDVTQIEALPHFVKQEHVLVGKEPGERRAFLLSEICGKEIACCMPGDEFDVANKATKDKKEPKPSPLHLETVWFLADGSHESAFAAVSVAAKVRLLPYAMLRLSCKEGDVKVATAMKESLVENSPEYLAARDGKQPGDTLRHQVYQHYNVASPKWEVSTTVSEASMNRR